jgi:hypothetical protein
MSDHDDQRDKRTVERTGRLQSGRPLCMLQQRLEERYWECPFLLARPFRLRGQPIEHRVRTRSARYGLQRE